MAVERPAGAIRFLFRIKPQHHSCYFAPISTFRIRVKRAQILEKVLLVVRGQHGIGGRAIGDIGMKRRLLHGVLASTDSRFTTLDVAGVLTSSTGDNTRWGGTVGVSLEYGFAPNWSVGVEYDHLFMQDKTLAFTAPGGVLFQTDRIRQDVDLVTARVKLPFWRPGHRPLPI
jgi:hypothetical protein